MVTRKTYVEWSISWHGKSITSDLFTVSHTLISSSMTIRGNTEEYIAIQGTDRVVKRLCCYGWWKSDAVQICLRLASIVVDSNEISILESSTRREERKTCLNWKRNEWGEKTCFDGVRREAVEVEWWAGQRGERRRPSSRHWTYEHRVFDKYEHNEQLTIPSQSLRNQPQWANAALPVRSIVFSCQKCRKSRRMGKKGVQWVQSIEWNPLQSVSMCVSFEW